MAAAAEFDFSLRQLGRNEGIEVVLDALHLLVFLALLDIGCCCGGDLFCREGNDFGLGA